MAAICSNASGTASDSGKRRRSASAQYSLAKRSVAPWEYVNHVVPRNLLLLYGREDRFILADTDRLLMKNATRGYLNGEGQVGRIADGSARRLLRVNGRGHLDLVYSEQARRVALEWLASTFSLEREIRLSPLRVPWVAAGTTLLILLVFLWNGPPAGGQWPEGWGARGAKLVAVAVLWVCGLALAAWVAPRLRGVPAQEGNVVAGVSGAETLLMSAAALPVLFRRLTRGERPAAPACVPSIARGAAAAVLVQLALEAVFHPMHSTPINITRLELFVGFLALAVPAFAATCSAAAWVGRGRGQILRGVPVEIVLAALTAMLAPQWFVRMSMLPVVVLALVLLFVAAYRGSGHSTAGVAAFGAVMYARCASLVCALY